jgi:hypothetical protein
MVISFVEINMASYQHHYFPLQFVRSHVFQFSPAALSTFFGAGLDDQCPRTLPHLALVQGGPSSITMRLGRREAGINGCAECGDVCN